MKSIVITGILLAVAAASAQGADISLMGTAAIPGNAPDRSGQAGNILSNDGTDLGIPRGVFGGAGSAIDYTGADDLYIMASDRGPNDGNARYPDRVHLVRLALRPGAATPLTAAVVETTLLTDESGRSFTGASTAFVSPATGSPPLRLDPEGIRMARDPASPGGYWISDEYGPYLFKFDRFGRKIAAVEFPKKYTVASPSSSAESEIAANTLGRIPNRGMEGLAITPDGGTLVGIMQNALLQDHALDAAHKRVSAFTRLITINIADSSTHEYVYQFESPKVGISEILALNDHEFLVLERDGKAGTESAVKTLYKIDLAGATDISHPYTVDGKSFDYSGTTAANGLPAAGPIPGIHPLPKRLFLDFLDPAFKLAGTDFPEKLEGLTFGPDFPNGDRLLIVTSDNDFNTGSPTLFYAFRVANAPSMHAQVH